MDKMKWILTIAFLLATAGLHSQVTPDSLQQRFDSRQQFVLDYATDFFESEQDTLTVGCRGSDCQVIWQDSVLFSFMNFGNAGSAVNRLALLFSDKVFLLQTYAGDGCPTVYQILDLELRHDPLMTQPFGNCESISGMDMTYRQISFRFASSPDINRGGKKVTYDREKRQLLTEDD